MAKFCLKKNSKRMQARKRYKIEKKVREHNRKKRKEAKLSSKRKPKVIHVPNECPFKATVLQERDESLKRKEEEKQKRREEMKQKKKEMKENGADEQKNETKPEDKVKSLPKASESKDARGIVESSTQVFNKPSPLDCKRALESADVVLQILDARDPLGTRCKEVEETATKKNQSLILVLNKADLIPRENLEKWLKYLRQSYPTVAFRSLTFKETPKSRSKKRNKLNKAKEDKVSEVAVGKDLLLTMLSNYCKNRQVKKSITVSVVGLPNVGKSSVVNSFKNSKICETGIAPGVTKAAQLVQVNPKIQLLDTPGIPLDDLKKDFSSETVLKNVVRPELIKDFFNPVTEILKSVGNDRLTEIYDVFDFDTNEEFFEKLARRCGRFKKGGDPDIASAAKIVLSDWNTGKIRHHTLVPTKKSPAQKVDEGEKDFEMEELLLKEKDILDSLSATKTEIKAESVAYKSGKPVTASILTENKPAKKKTVQKDQKVKTQEKTKRKETEEETVKPKAKRMKKAEPKVLVKPLQSGKEETDDYCFETDFVL